MTESRGGRGTRRGPHNENGHTTYRRIQEAALEVLASRGWRNASVAEVAGRAGVTRGAIQHHFKDREGLFTASVQHNLDMRVREIEALQQADYPAAERTRSIVRTVVDLHQGTTFVAALQLCMAATDDPILRPRIAAVELEVGARAFWALIELLELDGSDRRVRATVQAFLDTARGLGLAGMLNDDSRRRGHVADRWAEMLDDLRGIRPADNRANIHDFVWSGVRTQVSNDSAVTPAATPGEEPSNWLSIANKVAEQAAAQMGGYPQSSIYEAMFGAPPRHTFWVVS